MQEAILQDKPLETRKETLESTCDKVVFFDYSKQFTEEEIRRMETELSERTIEISDLEAKLKAITAEYKEQIKPMKEIVAELTQFLKYKSRPVSEECYIMYYPSSHTAKIFNPEGICVHRRPIMPGESLSLMQPLRDGTNDE